MFYEGLRLWEARLVVFYESLRLWEVHLYVVYVSGRLSWGRVFNQPKRICGVAQLVVRMHKLVSFECRIKHDLAAANL